MQFGMSHPAIVAMALNTSKPEKMNRNVEILNRKIPGAFWQAMKGGRLIRADYKIV
jgi:D-threo-aldose 1-dehydrogenase